MRLPSDWEAERASGWWEVHHLIHTPCGWRSHNAYDLIINSELFGAQQAREVVYNHECNRDD